MIVQIVGDASLGMCEKTKEGATFCFKIIRGKEILTFCGLVKRGVVVGRSDIIELLTVYHALYTAFSMGLMSRGNTVEVYTDCESIVWQVRAKKKGEPKMVADFVTELQQAHGINAQIKYLPKCNPLYQIHRECDKQAGIRFRRKFPSTGSKREKMFHAAYDEQVHKNSAIWL